MIAARPQTMHKVILDSYKKVGFVYFRLTPAEYQAALDYQEETGVQLFYPMIDDSQIKNPVYRQDPNAWFLTSQKGMAQRDAGGEARNIYLTDESSLDGYAHYRTRADGAQAEVRALYYD